MRASDPDLLKTRLDGQHVRCRNEHPVSAGVSRRLFLAVSAAVEPNGLPDYGKVETPRSCAFGDPAPHRRTTDRTHFERGLSDVQVSGPVGIDVTASAHPRMDATCREVNATII
jgi:hypothetical protein